MLELVAIIAVAVLAVCALVRTYVPPQTRAVLELEGRIADLEFAYGELQKRITKRARVEGLDTARQAHRTARSADDRATQEALAILENAQGAAAVSPGVITTKADLRARLIKGGKL